MHINTYAQTNKHVHACTNTLTHKQNNIQAHTHTYIHTYIHTGTQHACGSMPCSRGGTDSGSLHTYSRGMRADEERQTFIRRWSPAL
jgi:hypothetical protein